MLSNEEFHNFWRNNKPVDPDAIADETLRSMYVEYVAHELDMDDLYWKIERYLDGATGKRLGVFGTSDEDSAEQSDRSRTGYSN